MRRLIAAAPALALAVLGLTSSARAGDEQLSPAELDDKERELREDLFQAPTGRRSRFATEVELGTQVDWFNKDQHGTLHGGFGFSFSPQEVENLRVASFYAGVAVGQIGDQAHRWVHLETGWRPNFEIPVDAVIKPFLGSRHLVGMSIIGGDEGVDGTFANGASVGARLLGGIFSVEILGDAVFSWNREFLVEGERTHWVPRFGFNVKSDLCAFAGGDVCEYPAPTPEDVDLSALLDASLAVLTKGLGTDRQSCCGRAEAAVTLQVETKHPECGPADTEGFFCRFKAEAKASPDHVRLIERARIVHGELQSCYNQGRVDERNAALHDVLLQRKLRYGAYPPELRSAVCHAMEPPTWPDDESQQAIEDARQAKIDRARYACPRAAAAHDALAADVRAHLHAQDKADKSVALQPEKPAL